MYRIRPRATLSVFLLLPVSNVCGQDQIIDFQSDRWMLRDAEVVNRLGRDCLAGVAYLKDVEFESGVIEVDIAVDGARSYPGILFRMQSEDDGERVYLRPHRAGLYPDALQYAPIFNGVTCWQLYHGEGYTAPATIPAGTWNHVKMEIQGTQARVFLNDIDQPALVIHDLKHGTTKGSIGVMGPKDGTAYFSNFRYRATDDLQFDTPPITKTPTGTLTEWEISKPFPTSQIDARNYPHFFQIFDADWSPVTTEVSGLLNISRFVKTSGSEPQRVMARTIARSNSNRDVRLYLGYSDDVTVFLNGRPIFSGASGYRSRDPSFLGVVALNDTLYLPLQKGLNEVLLMVTDSFGGSGLMCRSAPPLDPPIRRHDLLKKVWETPDIFMVPESVLYDPQRHILYVTSFNKVGAGKIETGFISRVSVDGKVEDLHWITQLDGPCGMGILDGTLYVVEGPRGNLVEIDIDAGKILNRYPVAGATFLNDIAIDESGNMYISDTSRTPDGKDIYKFRDGELEVWKEGDEIHRSNGLFVLENDLIVGNSGDGLLKRVHLDDGRVSPIVSLGAGVIDGIKVDSGGDFIVSHWEGQIFLISPSGEIIEIGDTSSAGLNSADFEFIKDRNLLIVPTFLGNRVTAYELGYP